jgi:hypothetical protein
MIENKKVIEELSIVENLLKEGKDPEFNIIMASGKIRELKNNYKKIVEDFENEYAPKENQ